MKRSVAAFCLIFFLILTVLLIWSGVTETILYPFIPLNEKITLIAYTNYIALVACMLFSAFFMIIGMYGVITAKKPSPKVWKYFYATFIIALLGVIPRYHLGSRVDDAGYVKCVKESRTSSKSSWRVYAKSIDLCKESSGIAGG